MRLVVILLAVFFSAASAVSYRDSYRQQDLGHGKYLITTEANQYNSAGDAYQFAFSRARELCPDGFDILSQDGQAVAHSSDKNPWLNSEKHEVALVVQCTGEAGGTAVRSPGMAEVPPAASAAVLTQ